MEMPQHESAASSKYLSKITGLSQPAIAHLLSKAIGGKSVENMYQFASTEQLLIVLPTRQQAERLITCLNFFFHSSPYEVLSLYRWEILPFESLSPTLLNSAERLYTLSTVSSGRRCIVVTTPEVLSEKLPNPATISENFLSFKTKEIIERNEVVSKLVGIGYRRVSLVEDVGDFALRGAVIDIFPPGVSNPLRIELYGNRIDSIRSFSSTTQRSLASQDSLQVIPVQEFFLPKELSKQEAIDCLVQRADQLNVPSSGIREIKEAITSDASFPGIEHLQGLFDKNLVSVFDYFKGRSAAIVCNNVDTSASIDDFSELVTNCGNRAAERSIVYPEPSSVFFDADQVHSFVQEKTDLFFEDISLVDFLSEASHNLSRNDFKLYSTSDLKTSLSATQKTSSPLAGLFEYLAKKTSLGIRIAFVASSPVKLKRIKTLLADRELVAEEVSGGLSSWINRTSADPKNEIIALISGNLPEGLYSESERFVIISERDIFPDTAVRKTKRASSSLRRFIGAASQLEEEDYIVHIDHGVGIYRGLVQLSVEGKTGDFLHLEFQDKAKLYLPVDQMSKLQKYIGAEGKPPVLSRLGGKSWTKSKAKVQERVAELAGRLVSLYAKRSVATRLGYGAIDTDDELFADTFQYEETEDQQKAIDGVLSDMESDKPMDRLVCGDVGYGKTEVAMRAVFKAINAGKQAAILVPTTVLADQHYRTFIERFSDFPFNIGCVSRYFSSVENKETLRKLVLGEVDVIIGTHRLLQKDVNFSNLGLVVIDEEHRFGVAHKEKLKSLRSEVDILTLTATPIPRTLHMSLLDIRDLSVIETPPSDRQLIRTYLSTYDDSIVCDAIKRELAREGQVFYIHNRVASIAGVADEVSELVPNARVEFAHGQMKSTELEGIMRRFVNGEIDVLVSTTIVESGLDIPNANTIIIRSAENLGLAELYQLRGRVGRSSRRAYAYLLVSKPKSLGESAKKRLQAMQALDDLGVGFRLALQDMEIRGAGNLLGKDQSGQVTLVGYELYTQILRDAIVELKSKESGESQAMRPVIEPELKVGFPAHIPVDFIPDVAQRLLLYQRLVELSSEEEGKYILEEVHDRFGTPPKEVKELIELMILRCKLKEYCIVSISYYGNKLRLSFHESVTFNPQTIATAMVNSRGRMRISPNMAISVDLVNGIQSPLDLLRNVEEIVEVLSA